VYLFGADGHLASNVPSLPPKSWGVLASKHVAARQEQLELYLRRLFGLPRATFNPDFLRFLELL
jgi:hypothetical protein